MKEIQENVKITSKNASDKPERIMFRDLSFSFALLKIELKLKTFSKKQKWKITGKTIEWIMCFSSMLLKAFLQFSGICSLINESLFTVHLLKVIQNFEGESFCSYGIHRSHFQSRSLTLLYKYSLLVFEVYDILFINFVAETKSKNKIM